MIATTGYHLLGIASLLEWAARGHDAEGEYSTAALLRREARRIRALAFSDE